MEFCVKNKKNNVFLSNINIKKKKKKKTSLLI